MCITTDLSPMALEKPPSGDKCLRKRKQRKLVSDVPRLLHESSNESSSSSAAASFEHASPQSRKWKELYNPEPIVSQSTILTVGVFAFALATVWPPLTLLFAYVASKLIPYSFRVNDDACTRRQLYAEFSRLDDLPESFKNVPSHIQYREKYWVNARGMNLFTLTMTPKQVPVKAVVCFCHGYDDNISFLRHVEFQRLVNQGIAFVALEYEGHGRSDGPMLLINDWDKLIDDVASFYGEVASRRFPGKPCFIVGESMGGAVAYSVYNRIPDVFRGIVFVCPMCKICDDLLPPQWAMNLLHWLIGPSGTTSLLGYLPIAPKKQGVRELAHNVIEKADVYRRSPLCFVRNPRLATCRELIRVTRAISASLSDFDASFLVLHGTDDQVTDPKSSQALYNESKSVDKSIRLYEGMRHGLTYSEPDENIDRVFDDAIEWILARS